MTPQEYAHLLPAERVLWARYLRQVHIPPEQLQYDLRLGQGRPVDPTLPAEVQADWIHLTKQRVDVVRWEGTQATIFEVTPTARRAAYGALHLYSRLFRKQYPDLPPPRLVLVTTNIDPTILATAREDGIEVALLPPAPVE